MIRTTLILGLSLMAIGCRSSQPQGAVQKPQAPAGELTQQAHRVTSIDVGSPSDPKRLLRGFLSGNPSWRFTNRVFAVALDRPQLTETATFLEMDFVVPTDSMTGDSATVTVRANGIEACRRTYEDPDRHLLSCHIPEKALEKHPVEIEVETDRSFRDDTTGEERALVVVSLALKEYEATEEFRRAQIRKSREGYAKVAAWMQKLPREKVRELTGAFYRLPVWQRLSYQGIPSTKNPFDLFMIQQIIFETRPELIVETETGTGASALYYAAVSQGVEFPTKILTVDSSDRHGAAQANPLWGAYVEFFQGSATDPEIVKKISERVKNRRVLVTLGSGASTAQVLAALRSYAPLVSKGSYVVVEGAPLDGVHTPTSQQNGATAAVEQFLAAGGSQEFERDISREMFFWTSSPGGWLKRK
jgi:cephalosporin hydroxylase